MPYRKLEYIKFNGDEYIDTGILPQSNRYYYTILAFTATTGNQLNGSEVANAGSTNARFKWGISGSGYMYIGYGGNITHSSGPTLNTKYIYYCGPGTQYIATVDDSTTKIISGTNTITGSMNTNNIVLGGLTTGGTIAAYKDRNTTKLYQFTVYNSSTSSSSSIVNDYQPCQRKSDGVCGMYDVKNDVFYPMTGTVITNAAAGPVVEEN